MLLHMDRPTVYFLYSYNEQLHTAQKLHEIASKPSILALCPKLRFELTKENVVKMSPLQSSLAVTSKNIELQLKIGVHSKAENSVNELGQLSPTNISKKSRLCKKIEKKYNNK